MFDFRIYQDCFSTVSMRDIWSEQATIAAWVLVEQALAKSHAEHGLIPADAAKAIAGISTSDIDKEALAKDMVLVGRPIVGLVRQMRKLAGEYGPHVHYKSTTQDIMDTALACQMKAGLNEILTQIQQVIDLIKQHIKDQPDTKIIARTNGQHALPMLLRTKLEVWVAELERRIAALNDAAQRGVNVQVGGPSGEVQGYDARIAQSVKHAVAVDLGLHSVNPHWQNARDGVADIVTALGILGGSLEKIAMNINLLSSSDIAEASEHYENGRGASSSMAHKKNQRASEFGEAVARSARQRAMQITDTMMHQHERSGGAWIGEWSLVPDVFLLTSGALNWCDQMFAGLQFDSVVMHSRIAAFERTIGAGTQATIVPSEKVQNP